MLGMHIASQMIRSLALVTCDLLTYSWLFFNAGHRLPIVNLCYMLGLSANCC